MYFLALSHAPPALLSILARVNPVVIPPISNPTTPGTPKTTRHNRNYNCHKCRNYHFFLCAFGCNCHTFCILGSPCPFHNPRNFTELSSYFINHSSCIPSYSFHSHCNKYKTHHCSYEKPC